MVQKDLLYFTKICLSLLELVPDKPLSDWSLQEWHPRAVGFSNPNVKSYISGLYYLMFLILS